MNTLCSTEEGALEEQEKWQRDTSKPESEPQNTTRRLFQKELVLQRARVFSLGTMTTEERLFDWTDT